MKSSYRVSTAIASLVLLCFFVVAGSNRSPAVVDSSSWSPQDAAQYLDGRTSWWLGWSGAARGGNTACLSCHTSMPIALARSSLGRLMGETTPGKEETAVIADVRKRVENWQDIVSGSGGGCAAYYGNKKPSLGTESVLNALVLVNNDDIRNHGKLSLDSNSALQYLWDEQEPDGSWQWLDFGLKPWEGDGVYYGTVLAAVAVGMAGRSYYERPDLQAKIGLMRSYLTSKFNSRPLHDRVACLWASTWLPGMITQADRQKLIQDILAAQQSDGGWSLAVLGRSEDGSAKWGTQGSYPANSISDGYATGLAVLTLSRAKAPASTTSIQRGLSWLRSNERSGTWPVQWPNGARDPNNNDVGKFMEDASSSYAAMALSNARS